MFEVSCHCEEGVRLPRCSFGVTMKQSPVKRQSLIEDIFPLTGDCFVATNASQNPAVIRRDNDMFI